MNKAKIVKDFMSMFPVYLLAKHEGWRFVHCKTTEKFRTVFYLFDEADTHRAYTIYEKEFNLTCRPEIEERFRAVLWRVFQIQNHSEEELITLLKLIVGSQWQNVYEIINATRPMYLDESKRMGVDDPILNGEE